MKKLYFALVALMLCAVSAQAATMYLKPFKEWLSDDAKFAAWTWGNSGNRLIVFEMFDSEAGIYSANIESNTNVILLRLKPDASVTDGASSFGGWDDGSVWNRWDNLTFSETTPLYTGTSWDGGSWSTYLPPVVEKPTFSKEGSEFSEAFDLTITAADGATIYYTLNGEDPTTSSTEYTAPIQISETTTVKAIAVLNGVESAIKEATYTYFVLETAKLVVFVNNQKGWGNLNFYAWSTHMPDLAGVWPGSAMSFIPADDTRFPSDMAGTTWWQLRDLTVPANEDFNFILNNGSDTEKTGDQTGYNVSTNMEKGEDGTYYMYVILPAEGNGTQTGVNEIAVDENAPVEYFNFQGVRVANPEKGMYIRVQGGKATKVIL